MTRLLLIDDETIVRQALGKVLSQHGYSVSLAATGREGLRLLESEHPDLIVLDRDLPQMTGSAVLREIRKVSRDIPVIILTGHAEAEGEGRYRQLGVSAFLSKGTSMTVLLEAIKTALRENAAPHPSGTILLVDDDPQVRKVVGHYLRNGRYQVIEADDGAKAIEALKREDISVVLLDVMMPDMDGLQTLRALKDIRPDLRVIILTGVDDVEKAREILLAGASDYVTKPVDFEYLDNAILANLL